MRFLPDKSSIISSVQKISSENNVSKTKGNERIKEKMSASEAVDNFPNFNLYPRLSFPDASIFKAYLWYLPGGPSFLSPVHHCYSWFSCSSVYQMHWKKKDRQTKTQAMSARRISPLVWLTCQLFNVKDRPLKRRKKENHECCD